MEKSDGHSDLQERGPDETSKLRTDLFLPQLYKLFSTMRYNTRDAKLDQYQCPDGAGFRKNPDNGPPYDVQTLLPRKADNGELTCGWPRSTSRRHSTHHNMTQSGDLSGNHSVNEQYICLLKKLYTDQPY